jgi:hypothetical protein
VAVHGERKGVQMARATVSCTAAPATTDTLNFFYLPPGARVVGGYLAASDMDTNGSPTITLNIGDAGAAARLFSASTVAQAGTTSQAFAAGALDYQYAAKTLVTGVAQAKAATGAAGSVTLSLLYVVEE